MVSMRDLANISNVVYDHLDYRGWKWDEVTSIDGELMFTEKEVVEKVIYARGKAFTYEYTISKPSKVNVAETVREKDLKRVRAALYKNGSKKVFAIAGSNERADWFIDDRLYLEGFIPPQTRVIMEFFSNIVNDFNENFNECVDIYNRINEKFNSDIIITGHSLGGIIATILANKYNTRAVVFNSPGVKGKRNLAYRYNEVDTVLYSAKKDEKNRDVPNENINEYIIYEDCLSNLGNRFGTVYCVPQDGMGAHLLGQWLIEERYDAAGNLDKTALINNIDPSKMRD